MRDRNRDKITQTCTIDLLYNIQKNINGCVLKGLCNQDFDISGCKKEECFQCLCNWLNKKQNEPPK